MLSNKGEKEEDDQETVIDGSEPLSEPLNGEDLTAPDTVEQPWATVDATAEPTVHSTVEEPYEPKAIEAPDGQPEPEPAQAMSDEDLKKEMIRQTMSELGKRSAAARAKKKSEC